MILASESGPTIQRKTRESESNTIRLILEIEIESNRSRMVVESERKPL